MGSKRHLCLVLIFQVSSGGLENQSPSFDLGEVESGAGCLEAGFCLQEQGTLTPA